MTDTTLKNPLDRLGILPTTMNWRDEWTSTSQYYKHDVVTSPSNQSTYILVGSTVLQGGLDPADSQTSDWLEFSSTATGVQSVSAGNAGITVTGTTNPQIFNNGVISITQGSGIIVDNTIPNNPIIENDGVISIVEGNGIEVSQVIGQTGYNLVRNTGVLSVTPLINGGINIDNSDPQNPIISNGGVLSVTGGTGISTSPTTGVVAVSNDGVISITNVPNSGISVTGTNAALSITNTGVLSVASLPNSGITVTGTQTVTLSADVPQLATVSTAVTVTPSSVVQSGNFTIAIPPLNPSLWKTAFANAPPVGTPNPSFVLDLTRFIVSPSTAVTSFGGTITLSLVDSVAVASYQIGVITINGPQILGINYTSTCLGSYIINVVAARAAGVIAPDQIVCAISSATAVTWTCINISDIFATYYPQGVQ